MAEYPQILDQLKRGPPLRIDAVSGGCIAQAGVATFADGSTVFIKRAADVPDMFRCEADGLQALRGSEILRVPQVLAVSENALVLEHIVPGHTGQDFFARFGRQLADLHRVTGKASGYWTDNFIGSTPQLNAPLGASWDLAEATQGRDWAAFFLERRLRYQAELAAGKGHGDELLKLLDLAEGHLEQLLQPNCTPPSLLHGDLWAGNFMTDAQGAPCLIDPAVYFGHRETDLAMTRLFGGFDGSFYVAYHEAWPLEPEWEERVPVYQLYHLLNHLNLFGGGYYERCKNILNRFI